MFRYLPHNNPLISTILHNISQLITDMTVNEIFLYSRQIAPHKLIYTANWNDVRKTYFTIEESINVIEKLLIFQTDVKIFKRFVGHIGKKKLKMNCLYITSPPNAGKNFFFRYSIACFN